MFRIAPTMSSFTPSVVVPQSVTEPANVSPGRRGFKPFGQDAQLYGGLGNYEPPPFHALVQFVFSRHQRVHPARLRDIDLESLDRPQNVIDPTRGIKRRQGRRPVRSPRRDPRGGPAARPHQAARHGRIRRRTPRKGKAASGRRW